LRQDENRRRALAILQLIINRNFVIPKRRIIARAGGGGHPINRVDELLPLTS
jgi:hypothetical protein